MTSEHVVARVEHLTWLEPAASGTAEQEAVWMGEEGRREMEVGRRRGGRLGCTCLATCPGPIDQTAELAREGGREGGSEGRRRAGNGWTSHFFIHYKLIICTVNYFTSVFVDRC